MCNNNRDDSFGYFFELDKQVFKKLRKKLYNAKHIASEATLCEKQIY